MRKLKKAAAAILLCVVFTAAVLSGCGSKTAETTDKNEEVIKLNVVAGNDSVGHIDSVLAYTAGFYADEGLDVTMTNINTGTADQLQALLSGKADLTSVSSTGVLNYIDQGEDLVIIGGQMTNGASIFCTPERQEEFAEINGETLAGQKIGVTRLQSGDIAFRSYLNEQGVDLSTIEFVELDNCNTIIQAVLKGEVDLGIVYMTYRSVAEDQGLVVAKHLDELYNNFICCRLVTTRENLEANREAYVKAVKANIEAYNLICTDEDATIENALKGVEIDEDMIRSQLYEYGHLTNMPNPSRIDIEKFYASMVDIGYCVNNVDIDKYIDTSVFEDALAELIEEYPDNEVYQELKKISDETN